MAVAVPLVKMALGMSGFTSRRHSNLNGRQKQVAGAVWLCCKGLGADMVETLASLHVLFANLSGRLGAA